MIELSCMWEALADLTRMLDTVLQILQINVQKIPYIFMCTKLPPPPEHLNCMFLVTVASLTNRKAA
jgi:hypothetical protein